MTNKDKQPKNPSDPMQDLIQQAERFLGGAHKQVHKSVDEALSEKQAQENLDAIKKITAGHGDAFEASYQNFLAARGNREAPSSDPKVSEKSDVVAQSLDGLAKTAIKFKDRITTGFSRLSEKLHNEMQSVQDTPVESVSRSVVEKNEPVAPSNTASQKPVFQDQKSDEYATVDDKTLQKIVVLLQKMTAEAPSVGNESPWVKLDKLSSLVRPAWVSVMSQGEAAKSSGHHWLNEWEKIVKDIHSQSQQWPPEHKKTWGDWAQNWLNEVEMLRPWFVVAVEHQVNPHTVLLVPTAFKGRGVITSPPKGVPAVLVSNLQNCADYFEFHASKKSKFHWVNTPAKHAFEECQKELIEWKTTTEAQEKWKDNALQRYSILEGRLTLLAVDKDTVPTGRKNKV